VVTYKTDTHKANLVNPLRAGVDTAIVTIGAKDVADNVSTRTAAPAEYQQEVWFFTVASWLLVPCELADSASQETC
jgi:hypothetical protein